jgi:hypothetical protein
MRMSWHPDALADHSRCPLRQSGQALVHLHAHRWLLALLLPLLTNYFHHLHAALFPAPAARVIWAASIDSALSAP